MKFKSIIHIFVWMAGLLASSVLADDTGKTTQDAINLGAMTVTASKIIETLKEVPNSITVIDGAELEKQGITDIDGVISRIPNMNLVDFGLRFHSNVRGINTSIFTLNNPVVLYIDGIPQTNRYAYDLPLVNVERVEVLRGPQGSLYGKDAIGGVINMITKTPGDFWEGQVGLGVGNYKKREGSFSMQGPLSQGALYLGLYGRHDEDDGWIENTYALDSKGKGNSEMKRHLGGNLLWTPWDDFSARLHLLHERHDQGFQNGGVTGATSFNEARRSNSETIETDKDTFNDAVTSSQALHLEYESGFGMFQSVTTHRKTDSDAENDVDFGVGNPLYDNQIGFEDVTLESTSQEVRWTHELDSGMRWVAGLYYEDEQTDFHEFGRQVFGMDFTWVSTSEAETQAAFGQLTIPFLENFELTVGSRYQKIEKEVSVDYHVNPFNGGKAILGTPMAELDVSESWTAFLPKAALSYKIDDHWTTYASVATGYMPGGFNYLATSPDKADNAFGPQKSTSYELGVKGDMLGGALFLSAAAFYMDIEDIHVVSVDGSIFTTTNAGKGKSWGLEVEFDYLIGEAWRLHGGLGVTKAEYVNYTDISGNVNDGNIIENSPAHSLTLSLQYDHPAGYYAIATLSKSGRIYFDAPNTLEEDGYVTLDLKAGYRLDGWEFYAYVDNVTDADYRIYGADHLPETGPIVYFGDPREFGIGAKYRF